MYSCNPRMLAIIAADGADGKGKLFAQTDRVSNVGRNALRLVH